MSPAKGVTQKMVAVVVQGVIGPALFRVIMNVDAPVMGLRHNHSAFQTFLTPQVVAGSALVKSMPHPVTCTYEWLVLQSKTTTYFSALKAS